MKKLDQYLDLARELTKRVKRDDGLLVFRTGHKDLPNNEEVLNWNQLNSKII